MKPTTQMGAVILKTDGSHLGFIPANGKTFKLQEAQKIVGGYIEVISWIENGKKYILIINSDGKNMGLDINERATVLAKAFRAILPNDFIVGNAILCPSKMLP